MEGRILISMGLPPKEITQFEIEAKSESEIMEVEVKLSEKLKISLDKPSRPCQSYDNTGSSFNQCMQNFFKEYFKKNVECLLPSTVYFFHF
jgi:hypothetical protein